MRPAELKYTKTHEWARVEGDVVWAGITDYAVEHLSDLVYVELPSVGAVVKQAEAFGEIESVKAVIDLNSPVSGEVIEMNSTLPDNLETLSQDCYGAGWMIKIKMSNPKELTNLMNLEEYNKFCETEQH
jgi:glycine cleavage system H protein